MFVLTTLVYPVVLALLCLGAALAVDRACGGWLPGALLPAVGAAALIGVSQLSTYAAALAPATPYLLAAVALAGYALGRGRARALLESARTSRWQIAAMALAYALALAPVLLAGRATFSSYMALADSAVHMLGADYLIHHGQDYAHLDLRNSYGAFLQNYYNSNYPSGADTLFGGSTLLLRLPLIWTFQPFNAFALALAAGPAWVLVRRLGFDGAWAALATLTVTLPALVYAYELIGSVKEIVALAMILALGALAAEHRRWLGVGARGAIPYALLVAAGASALGVAFGAWALVATIVLAAAAAQRLARDRRLRRTSPLVLAGALVALVAAWPTWVGLAGSLHVAEAIASTSNPGNLHTPLRATQLLGVWLGGSYKLEPAGVARTLTWVLIAVSCAAALVGFGYLARSRRFTLAGWLALSILLWLALKRWATTWADAKTLMLTSPVAMLAAWAGVAAIRSSRARIAAPLVAFALAGGVLVSDALQYHSSNLAPTARYEELASIDTRFAGRGPALLSDFDEYALYELRDLDVGGPDFVYPPRALAAAAGHGQPVDLERIAPAALAAYPLIVTRRDPSAARPPAAYRLLWQGVYYQVWGRRARAPIARAHLTLGTHARAQCAQLKLVARRARAQDALLVGALAPTLVNVALARAARPAGWGLTRHGIVMGRAGSLHARFRLPHGGAWELWLKADVMRALRITIDGRALGRLGAQLDGNSLVANPLTPLHATLAAGYHTLTIARPGASLAPGDGGAATLSAIFLVPAGARASVAVVPARRWRSLCAHPLQWVETLPTR
jgi:hypothetical protein